MSKVWMWIVGVAVIVALGGGIFYVITRNDDGSSSGGVVQTGDSADAGATKEACDILTLAAAQQVLGAGAQKSELPSSANASTDDVSVTNCAYEADDGGTFKIASVLVRGAKNTDAYTTNEFGFTETRDDAAEAINGLGDDAYYNPSFEQVNVLVNSGQYWIIVQADGARAQSEDLARAVVENL